METDEEQVRYDRLTEVFQKSRPNQLPEPLISPCSVLKNYGMIEKKQITGTEGKGRIFMEQTARNIFRAVHEGKWLSIEYRNKKKKK